MATAPPERLGRSGDPRRGAPPTAATAPLRASTHAPGPEGSAATPTAGPEGGGAIPVALAAGAPAAERGERVPTSSGGDGRPARPVRRGRVALSSEPCAAPERSPSAPKAPGAVVSATDMSAAPPIDHSSGKPRTLRRMGELPRPRGTALETRQAVHDQSTNWRQLERHIVAAVVAEASGEDRHLPVGPVMQLTQFVTIRRLSAPPARSRGRSGRMPTLLA